MKRKNSLSIIIPTWNTASITLKCLQTIEKYLKKIKPQVIVVDNDSTDNTLNLLKNKKITLVENSKNFGFAKASNLGAKKATGDYLLFLNSDMELINNNLLKMFEFIQKNPQIGTIGPKFLNPNKQIQASVFPPQTIINALKEFWFGQKTYSKYIPKGKNPIPVWAISGGALMIKKTVFEKINGWNEKYFFYFEDLDLCRKLHRLNKSVYYDPRVCLIHRHGASGKTIATTDNQWRRLVPGAKKYHGHLAYWTITFIIKISQLFSTK